VDGVSAAPLGFVLALTEENRRKLDGIRILDVIDFVHDVLLPRLLIRRKELSAVLHPVCSVTKMGLTPKLVSIARACSESVIVPPDAGCCGFAGDTERGSALKKSAPWRGPASRRWRRPPPPRRRMPLTS
jgi:Fe-S oxidoreductase